LKALFISDLHLGEDTAGTLSAFDALIGGPARSVDQLYVLGDLFEHWIGDDDRNALARHVADAFSALADDGIGVWFLAGNRDFLIGEAYARQAGFRLLAEPSEIELDSHRVLLSHGDTLCTDDHAYQQYRAMVREPDWQHAFLARPLHERRAIVEDLRRRSAKSKQTKSMQIMDVSPQAVEDLLRSHGYPTLIHGHTHRPARHVHHVDGHECVRWVLPDWHDDAPYLLWDGEHGFITGRLRPEKT
jgi:UDP-2,3-diacylglucosamine hydrolase